MDSDSAYSCISGNSSPQAANATGGLYSDGISVGRRPTSAADLYDEDRPDMKEGRVILRMEVSHTEHSFLIGIAGDKVREMRARCSCLIHYPDGKETGISPDPGRVYPHLHSNEVSVRGKMPNVISGFQQVRDSIPFNLCYNVPESGRFLESEYAPTCANYQQVFSVEVILKVDGGLVKQVVVRGPQVQRTLIGAEAVCGLFQSPLEVSQTLCIHPHSQSAMWNLCDGEHWLKTISSVTKATINFPSARGDDKQTVTIRGSIAGVAAAWIILMSMLPVTVRVFIGHDTDFKRGSLERIISQELQVNFLVPRRERRPEDRQYVELRSFEGNIENICKAYKELMGPNVLVPKRVSSAVDKFRQLALDFAVPAALPKFLRKQSSSQTDMASLLAQFNAYHNPMPAYPPYPSPFFPPYVYPFAGFVPPFALECSTHHDGHGLPSRIPSGRQTPHSEPSGCDKRNHHCHRMCQTPAPSHIICGNRSTRMRPCNELLNPERTRAIWAAYEEERVKSQSAAHCGCNCRHKPEKRITHDISTWQEGVEVYRGQMVDPHVMANDPWTPSQPGGTRMTDRDDWYPRRMIEFEDKLSDDFSWPPSFDDFTIE